MTSFYRPYANATLWCGLQGVGTGAESDVGVVEVMKQQRTMI